MMIQCGIHSIQELTSMNADYYCGSTESERQPCCDGRRTIKGVTAVTVSDLTAAAAGDHCCHCQQQSPAV